jgi:hypothetical protein
MLGLAVRGRFGVRALFAFAAVALAMLVIPLVAHAAAMESLPGCTSNTLDANDDESTGAVTLPFTVSLNDTDYTSLYVNNNGNVTFDHALGDYTPYDFTTTGEKIIAPFLADVDTTGPGSSEVTYGNVTYDGRDAFCVNWKNVGYYNSHDDKLNSFQLILVKGSTAGDFDIVMNYDKVQWETGDASDGSGGFGGTSAAVGFSTGDGDPDHSVMLDGSFSPGSFLDSNPNGLIHRSRAAAIATTPGRLVYHVAAPTGPKVTGNVKQNGSTDPEAGAMVQFCKQPDDSPCVTRSANSDGDYTVRGLTNGTYDVTAFPGPDSSAAPGHRTVVFNGADVTGQDIVMGKPPAPPPPGTEITNIGTNPDGIPVAFWEDPLTLSTQACTGATVTYSVAVDGIVRNGSMAEGPAGTYTATVAAFAPNHGDAAVTIHVNCPGSDPPDIVFGLYIDPSGVVKDTNGNPIDGARVTLYRSSSASGPFFPVAGGSTVMSASNRQNSDFTTADGRFGWDVVAGFYKVRADADGCVSAANHAQAFAETGVMTIPPPVTNIDLRLFCPPPASDDSGTTTPITPPSVAPAGVLPNNVFKFGKVALKKNKGIATITVSVPGPGVLALNDGSLKAKVVTAAKKKSKKKKALIKAVRKNVAKAGNVKLTVTPTKAAKFKHGKLKVKLRITFTPTGGAARTQFKTVTLLKQKAAKKH